MKTNKLINKSLVVFASLALFSACDTETINELQGAGSGEIGAYAKVVTSTTDKSANLLAPENSSWDATIQFVDAEQGSLVDSYSIYATFRDNTIADEEAPDHSIKQEVLIETWEKSKFTAGAKYPEVNITVGAGDVISKLNLDLNIVEGGDAINYRGEIKLSDGRSFSVSNSGKSITSELFYNDAFGFSSAFVCVPESPLVGDWKIDMYDIYGDGWNGGKIIITLDGVATEMWALDTNGTSVTSVTFNVPEGSSTLTWVYASGSWESENKFEVYAPSGNLVLKDGPEPGTGAMALNLCRE